MKNESAPTPARLDYRSPVAANASRRRRQWWLSPMLCIPFTAVAVWFVSNLGFHCTVGGLTDRRGQSASNLRQIGQAILMYSNDFKGECPDELRALLLTEDLTADVFISPLRNDTVASGPTTRAVAANLFAGGHCSYVYLGKGLKLPTLPANAVMAYEKPTYLNDGSNVLFGDGHVEFCDVAWHNAFQAKLAKQPQGTTVPVTMP